MSGYNCGISYTFDSFLALKTQRNLTRCDAEGENVYMYARCQTLKKLASFNFIDFSDRNISSLSQIIYLIFCLTIS